MLHAQAVKEFNRPKHVPAFLIAKGHTLAITATMGTEVEQEHIKACFMQRRGTVDVKIIAAAMTMQYDHRFVRVLGRDPNPTQDHSIYCFEFDCFVLQTILVRGVGLSQLTTTREVERKHQSDDRDKQNEDGQEANEDIHSMIDVKYSLAMTALIHG